MKIFDEELSKVDFEDYVQSKTPSYDYNEIKEMYMYCWVKIDDRYIDIEQQNESDCEIKSKYFNKLLGSIMIPSNLNTKYYYTRSDALKALEDAIIRTVLIELLKNATKSSIRFWGFAFGRIWDKIRRFR